MQISKEMGLRVVETNASDVQSLQEIRDLIRMTGCESLEGGKVMLFDDVDVVDSSLACELLKFSKDTSTKKCCPVVCTLRDAHSPTLRSLKAASLCLTLQRVEASDMLAWGRKNTAFSERFLRVCSDSSGGDLRQFFIATQSMPSDMDTFSDHPANVLNDVFYNPTTGASVADVRSVKNLIPENYLTVLQASGDSGEHVAMMSDLLSDAQRLCSVHTDAYSLECFRHVRPTQRIPAGRRPRFKFTTYGQSTRAFPDFEKEYRLNGTGVNSTVKMPDVRRDIVRD
jgi:hypothetical protein